MSVGRASTQVLGVSYENLGMGIARSWGFPDQLVLSMKKLPAGRVRKPASNAERLCALAGFSNELCEIILRTPDADRSKVLAKLASRYNENVPLTADQILGLMEKSMRDIDQFARAVNVSLSQSAFVQRASKWTGVSAAPGAAAPAPVAGKADALPGAATEVQQALGDSVLQEHASNLDVALDASSPVHRTSAEIQAILTAGLQDVSNSLIDDNISINDILRMILEAMYTGMGFEHVVLCIKDGRHNRMCGKFGFGDDVQRRVNAFDFSMTAPPDAFLVALQNNADILIADIDDPKIASRIPAWYRNYVAAHTFVLFPIVVKGKPVGLIYADRAQAGDIVISEKELSLLKSLRNQAILAIRQSL